MIDFQSSLITTPSESVELVIAHLSEVSGTFKIGFSSYCQVSAVLKFEVSVAWDFERDW